MGPRFRGDDRRLWSHLVITNSLPRSRGACLRPGVCDFASPTPNRGVAERAPHSGSSLEHALNERGCEPSSIDTIRSQWRSWYVVIKNRSPDRDGSCGSGRNGQASSCIGTDVRPGHLLQNRIPAASRDLEHYFPSRLSVRFCNFLIKASAPPAATTEANSSRRMARSLMVPLR